MARQPPPQQQQQQQQQHRGRSSVIVAGGGTGTLSSNTSEQLLYTPSPGGSGFVVPSQARAAVIDIVAALLPPNAANVKQVFDQKLNGQVLSLAPGFVLASANQRKQADDDWLDDQESNQRRRRQSEAAARARKARLRRDKLQRSRKSSAGAFSGHLHLRWDQLQPLHELWLQYARSLLGSIQEGGRVSEQTLERASRMDLHGAILSVSTSREPSLVGLEGIVALETKSVFRLVLKDDSTRTVHKAACTFRLVANGIPFELYGPNMAVSPVARASRKVAGYPIMRL